MSLSPNSVYILEMLEGLALPARPIEIVDCAQENGASGETLDLLQALPETTYKTIQEINSALGLTERLPDHGHLEGSSGF